MAFPRDDDHIPSILEWITKRHCLWRTQHAFSSKFWLPICHPIYHENTMLLESAMLLATDIPFTLSPWTQRQQPLLCFFLPGRKGWPQIPTHRSAIDTHAHLQNIGLILAHTIKTNPICSTLLEQYTDATSQTHLICRSLPYRILEAESASIPTIKTGKKGLPEIFQRQGGKTMTNNDPSWHWKKNRPWQRKQAT